MSEKEKVKTQNKTNKDKVKKIVISQEKNNFFQEFQTDYEKTCIEFTKFQKNFDFMWDDEWLRIKFNKIKRFSLSDDPVLLIGETGTGKEIIARLIHYLSERKANEFFPINCSSFTNEMLYAELFGHEKGAFTSADRKREGILKSSDGGTVFLDEIQFSSFRFQQALLRFLDYGEIKQIGSDKLERADIRIITACCASPKELLIKGKLLQPFYYRISKLALYIPPLRERKKEIEKYIYYFLIRECRRYKVKEKTISPEAMAALRHYQWPGNIRELKAVIKSLVLLVEGENIKIDDLPEEIKKAKKSLSSYEKLVNCDPNRKRANDLLSFEEGKTEILKLDIVIREHIQKVLQITNGNKSKAAKLLGIPLTTLINKMKKLGID